LLCNGISLFRTEKINNKNENNKKTKDKLIIAAIVDAPREI
jgi:hypothetical protein